MLKWRKSYQIISDTSQEFETSPGIWTYPGEKASDHIVKNMVK